MGYDIIIGRDTSDKEKFGDQGLIYLGKGYVKMGNYTSLSNKLWMDVARSHVILIAGKRGSGKSYTLAAIAEELCSLPADISKNVASIIFDTMGIFWTMKYPNEKDALLLKEWDLETKPLPVKVFIPQGKSREYSKRNIPFDATFALAPSQLHAEDWITLFDLTLTSLEGVCIERIISEIQENTFSYTLNDIQLALSSDQISNPQTKEIVSSLFKAASTWGIFSSDTEGTKIEDLIIAANTTVVDLSAYSSIGAFNIRALIISLISRKIFQARMDARKKEEIQSIQHGQDYALYSQTRQQPLVWMFIDEAHEFLPKEGKTPATDALVQILREGRQPGISLVLATQQPGQIHKDVMTQSDIIIAHRLTAKADIDALNEIMQTYVLEGIRQQMDSLPSLKGSALLLDDNSERIYPVRIRPRATWHGGESPSAVSSKKIWE